jgi:hypothetical protein
MQDGLSYSSTAAAGCSQFLPVHDWQSAQEAAAAMGCVVQPLRGEGEQQLAGVDHGSSSSQQQQQQQQVPGVYGTQMLFHSAGAESQQLQGQQQQQQQQRAALDEDAADEQNVDRQQQQQQQDAVNAAAALASRAGKSPAGVASTTSPRSRAGAGAGSAAPAASKPWQRVSCAIRCASTQFHMHLLRFTCA